MSRRLVLTVLPLLVAGTAVAPSFAAPAKAKPFTMTYQASAPVPAAELACDGTAPMARDLREVKLPAAGSIKVDLGGMLGDWDLALLVNGTQVAQSINIQPLDEGEQVVFKVKRATTVTIVACNYNGGPTGNVTYAYKPS